MEPIRLEGLNERPAVEVYQTKLIGERILQVGRHRRLASLHMASVLITHRCKLGLAALDWLRLEPQDAGWEAAI